jgi:hypothetical protein
MNTARWTILVSVIPSRLLYSCDDDDRENDDEMMKMIAMMMMMMTE